MKEENRTPKGSPWAKTQHANLWRYVPSGTFYARARVSGKLRVRSLGMDTLAVARLRLGDFIKADGEILHFERAFVLVDGEPREYGRLLERVEQFNEHKLKAGDRCVVRLNLRPNSKNPRAWRVSGVVEPLAA